MNAIVLIYFSFDYDPNEIAFFIIKKETIFLSMFECNYGDLKIFLSS